MCIRVLPRRQSRQPVPLSSLSTLTCVLQLQCLIDYEVKAPGAINPGSDDAYERLSVDQRAIIDSISVDEQQRLTEAQRLRVRSLLAKHIRAFAMNPKHPAHTHLLEVELPLIEGSKPHRHAASRHAERLDMPERLDRPSWTPT